MILTNRYFKRVEPSREAKSIFIFCEGVKREVKYFEYFKNLDSRINIVVHKLKPNENNAPLGLLKKLEESLSPSNGTPQYDFREGDEAWIVLDIDKDLADSRKPQIEKIIDKCKHNKGWNLASSNPCFEVWLYYHEFSTKPQIINDKCSAWKPYVDSLFKGRGFDSRTHPIHIEKASINAENNYNSVKNQPDIGCTEVFKLANSIIPLIKSKLDKVRKIIEH